MRGIRKLIPLGMEHHKEPQDEKYMPQGYDIEKLYAIAQGLHIHTVVLATRNPITTTNSIYKKIREYGIDVWDFQKLTALATAQSSANATHSYSVLKTSDTSDDHCKIDPSSFNPIQDEKAAKTSSLFSGLFDKPDRL